MKLFASLVAAAALGIVACKQPEPVASNANSAGTSPSLATASNATADLKEECGTLVFVKSAIYLQVVTNNSEVGGDRLLEPQDGATENILREGAEKMSAVCIAADFSKPDPILVVSTSRIKPFTNK
jgi:hypothetical protein